MHLVDDTREFGSLNNFNAFCFENYLQKIKNMLRKSEKPLEQLIKRVNELTAEVKKTKKK